MGVAREWAEECFKITTDHLSQRQCVVCPTWAFLLTVGRGVVVPNQVEGAVSHAITRYDQAVKDAQNAGITSSEIREESQRGKDEAAKYIVKIGKYAE